MLNKKGERELAYVVKIDDIEPIVGSDNCEAAVVNGWRVMVRKNTFKAGDLAVYFEIDSKVDTNKPEFAFLEKKHGKIKTQKYTFGGKNPGFYSQGLLMAFSDFPVYTFGGNENCTVTYPTEGTFLTTLLGVTYADEEDNKRKSSSGDKYKKMASRHPKLFQNPIIKKIYKTSLGKKILFVFFGKKKLDDRRFPVGVFEGVNVTDQERVENRPWVLEDKTPYIKTQKCDGSSATYILHRKGKNKYEFYVCSRNVRLNRNDETYHGRNYYWEVADKYCIEAKMWEWLETHKELNWVCWQGEICAPGIQKNPHKLNDTHFYCFHWTDSVNGRRNILEAADDWKHLKMEVVPIIDENYILPDNMEEFKLSADGFYDASVCEGQTNCPREGFVYYKTADPRFSFKNVSREYLAKK